MSYSNPNRRHYVFPEASVDFSTPNTTGAFRGPRGKTGTLVCAQLLVSTTIAGTNNDAKINIGISGTLAKHMSWSIGEPVADGYRSSDDNVNTTNPMVDANLAADTDILVSIVEDTAGDGAGDGVIIVVVDWAD